MKKIIVLIIAFFTVVLNIDASEPLDNDGTEVVSSYLRHLCKELGVDAFNELCYKYNYLITDRNALRNLCIEKETEKLMLYTSHMPSEKRFKVKLNIEKTYNDSLYRYLIPYNQISGENISYALRIAKYEKFDSAQVNYLMSEAVKLVHRKETEPNFVVWDEDIKILKNALSSEQFIRFFQLKNNDKATSEFNTLWKKLASAGLTDNLDSVKESKNALIYISCKLSINDIYRHNSNERRYQIAQLNKKKPLLIKLAETYDKQGIKSKETEYTNSEFSW